MKLNYKTWIGMLLLAGLFQVDRCVNVAVVHTTSSVTAMLLPA